MNYKGNYKGKELNEVFKLKSGKKIKEIFYNNDSTHSVLDENGEKVENDLLCYMENGETKLIYRIKNGIVSMKLFDAITERKANKINSTLENLTLEDLDNIDNNKKGGNMGHVIFCILHFLAFMMFGVGLFVTIPLHIIYCVVKNK